MGRKRTKKATTPPRSSVNVLSAFVLRARRIVAHSLMQESRELMDDLYSGKQKVEVTRNIETGAQSLAIRQVFPPEEAMESLMARIRPLLLPGEWIYYGKVLNAIADLVVDGSIEQIAQPLEWWRGYWTKMTSDSDSAQAYSMVTAAGRVSDTQLTHAWLYGDLVHADDISERSRGVDIDDRYRAAAGVVARIAYCVELTLALVEELVSIGALELQADIFVRPVVATDIETRNVAEVLLADPDAVDPESMQNLGSLDRSVWSTVDEIFGPTMDERHASPFVASCRRCQAERRAAEASTES